MKAKKIIVLLLSCSITLGSVVPVFASNEPQVISFDDQKKDEDKQQQQQPQSQEQKKDDMSDQAAEQLLNSAQQDEKSVQRKVNQNPNNKRRSLEKDW